MHLILMASVAYITVIAGGGIGYRYFVSLPELNKAIDALYKHDINQLSQAIVTQESAAVALLESSSLDAIVTYNDRVILRHDHHNGQLKDLLQQAFYEAKFPEGLDQKIEKIITQGNPSSQPAVSYEYYLDVVYQLIYLFTSNGINISIQLLSNAWLEDLNAQSNDRLGLSIKFKQIANPLPTQLVLNDSLDNDIAYLTIRHTIGRPKLLDTQTILGLLGLLSMPIIITVLVVIVFALPMIRLNRSLDQMAISTKPKEISERLFVMELDSLVGAFNQLIRQISRQSELLKLEALTDGLTGIANRRAFDQRLDHNWRFSRRTYGYFSIVIADIDHFKAYNDHYGHQAGDQALTAVALTLRGCCRRATEYVARYGGEEFGLILFSMDNKEVATFLDRIQKSIASLKIKHGYSSCSEQLTVSIGACIVDPKLDTQAYNIVDVLIKSADDALYKAKNKGRNQYVINTFSSTDL